MRRREATPQLDGAGEKTLDARQSARIDAAGGKHPTRANQSKSTGKEHPTRAQVPRAGACASADARAAYDSWASPEAARRRPPPPPAVDRDSSFERQASWTRLHTWDRPDDDGAPSPPPRRGADDDGLVGRHPPWRAAVDEWERNGVVHSYDILDDAHPLLRTRHLIRRTSVLSSTTATSAASVLALLADERRRAEGEAGEEEKA